MTFASQVFTAAAASAMIAAGLATTAAAAEYARPNQFAQSSAAEACLAFNPGAEVLKVVDDGVGDYLVWLLGNDGLVGCNAGADGRVYANVAAGNDMLLGIGAPLLQLVSAGGDPAARAETTCSAQHPAADIFTTVIDGRGSYLVWMQEGEAIILCNASAKGELWMLEDVGPALQLTSASDNDATDFGAIAPEPQAPAIPVSGATPAI